MVWCSHHETAILFTEVGDISNEYDWLWEQTRSRERDGIKRSLYPGDTVSALCRKLCESLLFPDVYFPERQVFTLWLLLRLETMPTPHTSVSLHPSSFPILPYLVLVTGWTHFVSIFIVFEFMVLIML